MGNLWVLLSACENPGVLKVLSFVLKLMDVVFFIVPMGLIVMISIDFFKNVIASKEDEYKRNLNLVIKRLLYTVALFLLPTMVEFMLGLVSDVRNNIKGDYQSCIDNIAYIETYEAKYEEKKQKEEEEWKEYLEQQNADEKFKSKFNSYIISNFASGVGTYNGQKYTLTEEQLWNVASVCHREQGDAGIEGIKAEASLLLNWFEIYKGGTDFWNGMKDTFFFKGYAHGDERPTPTQEEIDAVRIVFELGQRTLPLYIDEHDSIGDIAYVTDGKGGRITDLGDPSQYVKDQSIVYQNGNIDGGDHWTYYCHPNPEAKDTDPFGYTDYAKKVVQSRNS